MSIPRPPMHDPPSRLMLRHAQSAFSGAAGGRDRLADPLRDAYGRTSAMVTTPGQSSVAHIDVTATGQTLNASAIDWDDFADDETMARARLFVDARADIGAAATDELQMPLTGPASVAGHIVWSAGETPADTVTVTQIRNAATVTTWTVDAVVVGQTSWILNVGRHLELRARDLITVTPDGTSGGVDIDSAALTVTQELATSAIPDPEVDLIVEVSGFTSPYWFTHDGTSFWFTSNVADSTTIHEVDPATGTSIGTITGPALKSGGAYGQIAWDGSNLWISSPTAAGDHRIFEMTRTGTVLSQVDLAAPHGAFGVYGLGIAPDGAIVAGDVDVVGRGKFYRFNASTGALLATYDLNPDSSRDISGVEWVSGTPYAFDDDQELLELNPTTFAVVSSRNLRADLGFVYDLAWDGSNLWVSDFAATPTLHAVQP